MKAHLAADSPTRPWFPISTFRDADPDADGKALDRLAVPTASAEGLLARMQDKVGLCGWNVGDTRHEQGNQRYPGRETDVMDSLRRSTPPWSIQEGDDQCFWVFDATGFFICSVTHEEDLHARSFHYADSRMRREEARRITKAISRLPVSLVIFLHGSLANLGATFVFGNNVAGLFASAVRDVPCNGFGMFASSVVIGEVYADRVFQPVAIYDGKVETRHWTSSPLPNI